MRSIRQFNARGLRAAEEAWERAKTEVVDFESLLEDGDLTEPFGDGASVQVRAFENRLDAGRYFFDTLAPFEATFPDIGRAKGLWTWLAFAWLDVLAPVDASGMRNLQAQPRLIAMVDDWKTYYRHLLAGPYRIYRAHRDDPTRAMAVLATAVEQPGEAVEALSARQDVITNPNLMRAATTLYYDATTSRLKVGSGGKVRGAPRRLVDIVQQFDLTWDFFAMEPEEILALLPPEFDRFR